MSENKRILKNSIILYFRLIITTVIGLYTTRIVLIELGAEDFGLYAVVGGIVSMLGFLNTAMLATSFRFIAIEIGLGDKGNVNKVFNTSLVIHLVLALFILIIGETIGIWYIRNYLNVAPGKISDALFVMHLSIVATMFSVVCVPYQGLITARENFFIRASIEIVRALTKLGLVFILVGYLGNKLRAYAIIMAIVMFLPSALFFIYSLLKERAIIAWNFNRKISDYKQMIGFTSWILIGTVAYMGVRQGAAIIINLFFGTVINASFGIASQINNYIMVFVKNLNQAAVPQIMKSHSSGDTERSLDLVYNISKYSFFIMLIPAVPIMLSIESILILWLKEVPEFTKEFTLLMILNGLIGVTSSGFDAAIQATGNIRKVHIWYSLILLSTLPIAYAMFVLGFQPFIITILFIGASLIYRVIQVKILTEITEFKFLSYWKRTLWPTFIVSTITMPQVFLRSFFGDSLMSVVIFSLISVGLIVLSVYFFGLTKNEKQILDKQFIKLRDGIQAYR